MIKTIEELEEKVTEHKKNCCCLENEKLQLDNENLRSLLKECLDDYKKNRDFSKEYGCKRAVAELEEVITRINAALGESEE